MINQQQLTIVEQQITQQLADIMRQEISTHGGSMALSRYMQLALFHQQYGYYQNSLPKFGGDGDFITAPLISKSFAYALAQQFSQLFTHVGTNNILEIGAGNGQFMLDSLSIIGEEIDNYYILELSDELARLQAERLQQQLPHLANKVTWLNTLPTNFVGIVFANEVLDCQPCDSYVFVNDELKRIEVTLENNQFAYIQQPFTPTAELMAQIAQLPEQVRYAGYNININSASADFIHSLAQSLTRGAIIFIDYGYGENEFYSLKRLQGTIRGFFRHRLIDNILVYPGLIDITASVNFTHMANVAIMAGLDVVDYTHQAAFLLNCGIVNYAQLPNLSVAKQYKRSNEIQRLTAVNGLGEVFKVLGLTKGMDFFDWRGFDNFSQAHLL